MLWSPSWVAALTSTGLTGPERLAVLMLSLWLLLATPTLLGRVRLSLWVWAPAFALVPPFIYLCLRFDSVPGDALVAAALHTAPARSLEVVLAFGPWLWVWAAAVRSYLSLAWHIDAGWRWHWLTRKRWLAGLLGVASVSLVLRQTLPQQLSLPALFDRATADLVFPLNLARSVDRVLEQSQRSATTVSIHGRPRPGTADQALHLVLVIGESVRPDHLSLYGYPRDTTPGLQRMAGAMLRFDDVASIAHWTDTAVPCIVSRPLENGRRAGLVRTLDEAGFHTAWLSNQESSDLIRSARVADFARDDYDFHLRLDTALLPPFEALLRQAGPRQFIALHMIGSHFPYEERYDARARRFGPTLADAGVSGHPGPKFKAEAINSYDNSLVALDQFLMRVVAALQADPHPALLVFTSDHGENLFDDERQRFMHALRTPSKADTTVPLFVWANEAHRRSHPGALRPLTERLHAPISHIDLMPTLLDLAGVDAEGLRPEHSLLSPAWRPHPRHLQQIAGPGWDYDAIR